MPKIAYISREFSAASLKTIRQAEDICNDYTGRGFTLTLRQLYYQFVARGLIPNRDSEYKRLGSIINDARLAGMIDWYHLEDRTRNLRALSHWTSPAQIIDGAAYSYRIDRWATQPNRVEVWIEKDALVGVIERVCNRYDVPYFSCRGYTSQSEVWGAAQRLASYQKKEQQPVILHLGDHDPSGIDMTRDITDRLALFLGDAIPIDRLALNFDQVEQYSPPPNPAKLTDSRAVQYIRLHGDESWELDALDPEVISALIETAITRLQDKRAWSKAVVDEDDQKQVLKKAAKRWGDVVAYLQDGKEAS